MTDSDINIHGISGTYLDILGKARLNIKIGDMTNSVDFHLVKNLPVPCLIGSSDLKRFGAKIDLAADSITFDCTKNIPLHKIPDSVTPLLARKTYTVGPKQSLVIYAYAPRKVEYTGSYNLEYTEKFQNCTITSLINLEGRKRVKVQITNTTNKSFTITKDAQVANVKPLQQKDHSIYYLSEHELQTEFDIDVLSKQEACFATKKKCKRPIEKPTHSRKLEEVDPQLSDRDIIVRDLKFKKSLLTKEQQKRLFDLVYKYREAISLRGEIGKSKLFEYKLKLKDDASLLCKQPYQISMHEKGLMKREIEKLLKMNVIEPVTDPYVPCCAPAILVAKRDKSARLVY